MNQALWVIQLVLAQVTQDFQILLVTKLVMPQIQCYIQTLLVTKLDILQQHQSIQIFHNKRVSGGLKKSCEYLNIGFEGEAHRALSDAINTFRVWHHLIKRFNIY